MTGNPGLPLSRRSSHIAVAPAAIAIAIVAACRPAPRVGGECRVENQWACAAKDQGLLCEAGAWRELPCRGSGGCSLRGHNDECDDTVAQEGDPCPRQLPTDFACSVDGSRALVCTAGRFDLWRNCRGSQRCAVAADRHLDCDTTLGQAADPCEKMGTYACSVDEHAMLLCDGHALELTSSCRGPGGCRFDRQTHKVDCDDRLAAEGDACDQPNRITCSIDRKLELACDPGSEHRYVKKRECRRTECRIEENDLFCD
jgi:hypothetical protein